MTKKQIPEEQQRELFAQLHNNKAEDLYFEVPVFCRSVDVVIYNSIDSSVTAIEFKVRDWKRALDQALSVALCFDYLEICVPKPKTDVACENLIRSCNQVGVGVYFFDTDMQIFEHPLFPLKVAKIWEIQRKNIINYVGRSVKWQMY